MAVKHTNLVTYRRDKDIMEISGDADKVKKHIWFDQISHFTIRLTPKIISGVWASTGIPSLWEWFKRWLSG